MVQRGGSIHHGEIQLGIQVVEFVIEVVVRGNRLALAPEECGESHGVLLFHGLRLIAAVVGRSGDNDASHPGQNLLLFGR